MTFNTNTKGALQSLYTTRQQKLKVTAQYFPNVRMFIERFCLFFIVLKFLVVPWKCWGPKCNSMWRQHKGLYMMIRMPALLVPIHNTQIAHWDPTSSSWYNEYQYSNDTSLSWRYWLYICGMTCHGPTAMLTTLTASSCRTLNVLRATCKHLISIKGKPNITQWFWGCYIDDT